MKFESSQAFTGDPQKAMDFIASFLVNSNFDIERRGANFIAATRSAKKKREADETRESFALLANPVRGMDRIEMRHEAGTLRAIAESGSVTSWKWISVGSLIVLPAIILRLLYLLHVGRLRDDEGNLVGGGSGLWMTIGFLALFMVIAPSSYVSMRKRTQKSVQALLENAAAMARGKGQG